MSTTNRHVAGGNDPHAADGIRVDPYFASLIPPLTPSERRALERNLLEGRCGPLTVWTGHNILVDGHHELSLCRERGITIQVTYCDFADRAAVIAFISAKELARSTLSAMAVSYLRGTCYLSQRQPHGGDRRQEKKATDHSDRLETAQRLAAEYKVGQATIRRDAQFTTAVDAICANCGDHVRRSILTRHSRVTRKAIIRFARLDALQQQELIEQLLLDGKLPWEDRERKKKAITLPRKLVLRAGRLLKSLGTTESLDVCRLLAKRLRSQSRSRKEI